MSAERSRKTQDLLLAGGSLLVALGLYAALAGSNHESSFVGFLGRFHPLAVHLPIGMLLLVGALEGLSLWPAMRSRTDPALGIILRLTLAATVAAFALGLLLASTGGYPERLLALHRRLTLAMVVSAAISVVTWSLHVEGRTPRGAHRAAVGLTLALLGIGAHFGGSLTHGESYLLQYAPFSSKDTPSASATPPPTAAPGNDPRVFDDVVLPVLRAKCVSCHGPDNAKGRLRVDSLDALTKGGKSGPAVVAGDATKSLLLGRIKKPLSDDEHMPPENKPQLTQGEIDLLGLWIERGASPTTKVRELVVPDGARKLLDDALGGRKEGSATPTAVASVTTAATTPEPAPTQVPAASTPSRPSEPAATSAPATSTPTTSGSSVFQSRIAPILAAKCGSCHGAAKQKGKLRTDSMDALVTGGKSGPAIVPGSPGQGTLLARIQLPASDGQHMPPREEAQLDANELRTLAAWAGGSATQASRPKASEPAATRPTTSATSKPAPTDPPPAPTATAATKTSPASTAASSSIAHPVPLFADVVQPILVKRCGKCHTGDEAQAGVVVTSREKLVTRGQVVPGRPDTSSLFTRMALPPTDDDHMPPKEAPQPVTDEIAAVRLWIERGASETGVVEVSDVPSSLLAAPGEPAGTPSSSAPKAGNATSPTDKVDGARVHGGCAGCSASDRNAPGLAWSAGPLVLALFVIRRKARRRRDR